MFRPLMDNATYRIIYTRAYRRITLLYVYSYSNTTDALNRVDPLDIITVCGERRREKKK
jgi:hypothetical protein